MDIPTLLSGSEDSLARSISAQYAEIQENTERIIRLILRFGATFARAEAELESRGLLGNRRCGQGMAAWLAENCPEVNYKTAMRWKQVAKQSADSLGCDNGLTLLCGDADALEASPELVRARVDQLQSAPSVRKLSQMAFDFASEDKGAVGRPLGSVGVAKSAPMPPVESARLLWARPMAEFGRNRGAFYSAAKLLPLDDAKAAYSELCCLVDVLKARIKEGK